MTEDRFLGNDVAKQHVMISYRSLDKDFVVKLKTELQKKEITPWVDEEQIKPGMKWRNEILNAPRLCDACLVVLSPEYLESEHCRMEVFIARSFGRPIIPVMLRDCFSSLDKYDETQGLANLFMMLMFRLSSVGLPITQEEALKRVVEGVSFALVGKPCKKDVYISYASKDADLATNIAQLLETKGISAWVATTGVYVGENWRDAQVRAMMSASIHIIILDENMVSSSFLRTEILLSEARELETVTVLPPRLLGNTSEIRDLMDKLDRSDKTYRRLTELQYFTCEQGVGSLIDRLYNFLTHKLKSSNNRGAAD